MPEHLDARKTISRDMFYYILASKLPSQKNKNKNLTPDHKISEKRMLTNFFFTWPNGLMLQLYFILRKLLKNRKALIDKCVAWVH